MLTRINTVIRFNNKNRYQKKTHCTADDKTGAKNRASYQALAEVKGRGSEGQFATCAGVAQVARQQVSVRHICCRACAWFAYLGGMSGSLER